LPSDRQELYDQALFFLEKWDLDKAEETLRKLIELEPEFAPAWNKLGVLFARRKDLRQAEECFEEALRLDPRMAEPHSNLGNIYLERGWFDRAKAPTNRLWCSIRATRPQPTIWVCSTVRRAILVKV